MIDCEQLIVNLRSRFMLSDETREYALEAADALELLSKGHQRDLMAAALVLPTDMSRATGRVLAGPEPTDGIELIRWWARAKARLRYIEVDAMLAVREKHK